MRTAGLAMKTWQLWPPCNSRDPPWAAGGSSPEPAARGQQRERGSGHREDDGLEGYDRAGVYRQLMRSSLTGRKIVDRRAPTCQVRPENESVESLE